MAENRLPPNTFLNLPLRIADSRLLEGNIPELLRQATDQQDSRHQPGYYLMAMADMNPYPDALGRPMVRISLFRLCGDVVVHCFGLETDTSQPGAFRLFQCDLLDGCQGTKPTGA